jgi:tryptophanase
MRRLQPEPFKIKVVEKIHTISRKDREKELEKAGHNIFNIPACKVFIDLLTDSGTSAMSDNQWSGIMIGDEAYAGCNNYANFVSTIRDITGFDQVIPVHQGRAAEGMIFSAMSKEGNIIPSNTHFDTTRANIEHLRARAIDCLTHEAEQLESDYPFKGNMDIERLKEVIEEFGPDNIPMVMMTITNNSGGGQPVSLENIRQTSEVARSYGIPLWLDACRFAENCFFIKIREPGQMQKSVKEIAAEVFSYADGCFMSAKKDGLSNIGGFIATSDEAVAAKLRDLLVLREGFPTYGGLAGRDLEAIARGLVEGLDEQYLSYRIGQVMELGHVLIDHGVPIMNPIGGHAIYLEATSFCPHIPVEQFPGQAVVIGLYREYGIRAVEIGSFMFGKSEGRSGLSKFELVRMAIPRRVYTASHIDYVAASVCDLYTKPHILKGLRITYEAPHLRHFTSTLEEIQPIEVDSN